MTDPSAPAWGQRALEHAARLTNASSGRGSATQAEAQAAEYVQAQLGALGVAEVRRQPFLGLRSIWLFMALVFGLALVGHAAFWLLRPVLGAWLAWFISLMAFALGGFILWRKFTFRSYPLRSGLPHGPSQNVLAVLPAAQEPRRRVLLVSHLDSHRAVFWFASDFLVRAFALSEPLALFGIFFAPLLYALAALSGWQAFAWLGAALALVHFVGWFSGITADLGPYSPGANDNAAAAGTLLALAERLRAEPLPHTEVWLAFTGCEETGCDGMLALLAEQRLALQEALILDLELVGIGEQLVYMHDEGVVRRRTIDPQMERLLQEAGQGFDLRPVSTRGTGAFTETGAAWEHGFRQAACILALRQGSPLMPEWHRLSDRADRLQVGTLERVHALTWEILRRYDVL